MSVFSPASAEVGTELPELPGVRVTRTLLALFAGASGDHNPIHIDSDAARAAGLDDVIAHGMLSMALLGRLLTTWVPVEDLLSFKVRFSAPTPVHAVLRCTARITAIDEDEGVRRARLSVTVRIEDGPVTVRGEAFVRLPDHGAER
ncbi:MULTISPECIES: MaoC/PaaZ C-terminal domain-containing protein [unclassified Streptomyces]|uniref:MaoC/PaaZ C-terminal domain-containing protein n=1 Tax=unclassified Streptomyces TaxID=2593676 RepID=UPI001BAF8AFC|nr:MULTISPECIES: MaoC/PaaZ C-terminal domain-containing protein [unclassified Streptomyces]MDH6454513.1 acyl dehydratase [Streptomyces sp. SAI-119]MDH6494929.1 acyl dehydratase [Streptomyces sp. SAI-149]QUC57942.1 MaoC family dehydratase N-terminal domain-containing protein [Streptomyces sp. A2-16]